MERCRMLSSGSYPPLSQRSLVNAVSSPLARKGHIVRCALASGIEYEVRCAPLLLLLLCNVFFSLDHEVN